MKQLRQGDLLIKQIGSLPQNLKESKDNILLRGEVTGHSHLLQGGRLLKDKAGAMFLDIPDTALLVHEEHKPIKLSSGKYAVVRQREYQSKDMTRLVID